MKYDLADLGEGGDLRRELRDAFGLPDDLPVVIGGSVHAGEYEALGWAYRQLIQAGYRLRLVLVPRYTAEAATVAGALRKLGLTGLLKSRIDDTREHALDDADHVLIVDTMGELKAFYAMSDIAYVGGSLTFRGSNKGGHNLMEPAILGVVPMFGPFNYSFRETVRDLTARGAGLEVQDKEEIRDRLRHLLDRPGSAADLGRKARQVILANRGATDQVFGLLSAALEASRDAAALPDAAT